MSNQTKHIFLCLVTVFIILFGVCIFGIDAHCENVVVVIDPGHGGEALGGNMDDRIERDINLITAMALKERLEQYEGVDVFLTRDNNDDADLSRKERMEFAKKVNADFLFSIHYNMSENHSLFGSEVWVQSQGQSYVKGYAFAAIEMEALTNLGLFDRGIKNKLDNDGTGEYYGILKYAEEYNIPAVIIEHCHLDEERDSAFWNEDGYKLLGQTDADSIAKYFKLSSSVLGIDNSSYENIVVDAPSSRLNKDMLSPQFCNISVLETNDTSATIQIEAADSETYIQYYQVSTNGGKSFGRLEVWEDRNSESQMFSLPLEADEQKIVVVVYDQYENSAISDAVSIPALIIEEAVEEQATYTDIDKAVNDESDLKSDNQGLKYKYSSLTVFIVTLIALLIVFNIIFAFVVFMGREKESHNKKSKSAASHNKKHKNAAKATANTSKSKRISEDRLVIEKAQVKEKTVLKEDDDDILDGFDWK